VLEPGEGMATCFAASTVQPWGPATAARDATVPITPLPRAMAASKGSNMSQLEKPSTLTSRLWSGSPTAASSSSSSSTS